METRQRIENASTAPLSLLRMMSLGDYFAMCLGITLDMMNIPAQTLMREQAPEEERGRVFSFQAMLYNAGSIPVLLFAGVIADILGIETVMYLLAAAILGFCWWTAWYSHHSFVL